MANFFIPVSSMARSSDSLGWGKQTLFLFAQNVNRKLWNANAFATYFYHSNSFVWG